MSVNKEQIAQLVRDAYQNDEVVELLAAMHETANELSENYWNAKLSAYPVIAKTLKRHGKEEARSKLGTWLMMMSGVLEYAKNQAADWKLYRDETREEHHLRHARQELARAERDAAYKRSQVDAAVKDFAPELAPTKNEPSESQSESSLKTE